MWTEPWIPRDTDFFLGRERGSRPRCVSELISNGRWREEEDTKQHVRSCRGEKAKGECSRPPDNPQFWSYLWQLKLPPRVVVHFSLDSYDHWRTVALVQGLVTGHSMSMAKLVVLEGIVSMLWSTWKARNCQVAVHTIIQQGLQLCKCREAAGNFWWRRQGGRRGVADSGEPRLKWKQPSATFVKINCDACWLKESNQGATGIVCRDSQAVKFHAINNAIHVIIH
ncbi:hypothetical protein LIER_33548 [Lithospermum erythrorhizon]|uniref:Uncharacterized protein n=1 Tax=Lithospermum erythrorhizon TaxID=34254 RepID=A0AAV3S0G3_LITER